MKIWITKNSRLMIGALAGAATGIGYWYFFSCDGGSCAITSNPFISAGYFALMGLLLSATFRKSGSSAANKQDD